MQAANSSEEYLLYDLTKDARSNRVEGIKLDDADSVGKVVYPVVPGSRPFENGAYPADERHIFHSRSFYWADDSSAVVFADGVNGRLVIVLVSLGAGGAATYIHHVSVGEVCTAAGSQTTADAFTLIGASVSADSNGGREVEARFSIYPGAPCQAHALTLSESAFRRAPTVTPAGPRLKRSILGR